MNSNILICLGLALQCLYAVKGAAAPAVIQLSGTDWRIHDDVSGKGTEQALFAADPTLPGWIPATVPGNIQSDLESAHQLEPLWYGAGDPRLKDVSTKDWWYRKDFTIPASFVGKRLTLVFDGVDQQSEIWLNGQKIGSNTNMFRRFWFDVTSVAKAGGSNQLAVRIAKYVGRGAADFSNEWKSGTNLGWDWGISISTLGIWKDVRLEATGPARIDWTRVQTTLSEDQSKASVFVSLEIHSAADLPAKVQFRVTGQGETVTVTVEAALKKGVNMVKGELALVHPALWWPSGQGGQPLYTAVAELQSTDGGDTLDERTTRFGVRDLRWVYTQDAPADFINRFQLVVNGRPVRTIGSNLIPADLLFGRMTPRALNLLHQAKAAGMNTLRIWGGGVICHEAVYDLADELGLLLVQELPMFHYTPPQDAEYLAKLEPLARNVVRQVRNHPAIIEFDGGNEMRWRSDTNHPVFLMLKKVVAEEDGRIFRAGCPDIGSTHGAWHFTLWPSWPGCRFYNDLKTTISLNGKNVSVPSMRAGEFGSASPAHLEVWQREIPPKDQWPIIGLDNEVLHRKKTVRAIGPHNWLQKNAIENEFGPFDNLPDLIQAGQFRGAEALRYAMDALRRMGKNMGGMTTWDLNEPWPNGAGSYLVDYDGRPKMMYDFLKQAIAPITLSLKYESVFYPLDKGIKTELFLTSDAPQSAENLRWKWVARDRRGTVFAHNEGTASIGPIEVKALGEVALMPPAKTVFGPIFMELRLEDAGGKLLVERLHIFGLANLPAPFAQLVKNNAPDLDDDASQIKTSARRPSDPGNLIYRLSGKGMTPPPANVPPQARGSLDINDGEYGNDHAWSDGWFEYKLNGKQTLGRFTFGRDRTGVVSDRCADYMKIETSLDSNTWQTVYEADKLTQLPGFSPAKTIEIQIAPVQAQYLKVTVMPPGSDGKGPFPVIDEFEVYAPATNLAAQLPHVVMLDRPEVYRPLRHTTLRVEASPVRIEGKQEVLELKVKNTGAMTAFPCEVHPLISYRTDLFIDNNNCFIPPGESRVITIRSQKPEGGGRRSDYGGLTLAQTGWWISSWNADRIEVAPSDEVLLAVGRRDQMCREFLETHRPEPSYPSYLLDNKSNATFKFMASKAQAKHPARLRLHTSDQSKEIRAAVEVTINGKTLEQTLPEGLGIQKTEPAHLSFPATLEFELASSLLLRGKNVVEVRVKNEGWFTWDSLECVSSLEKEHVHSERLE